MPVPYTYDPHRNTVDCRPYGLVVIAEVVRFFDAVRADATVREGAVEVVYLDGVENFRFSSHDARIIPQKIGILRREKALLASVLVAEGAMHFGMARMFATLHELADAHYPVVILRDLEELEPTLSGFHSEVSTPG